MTPVDLRSDTVTKPTPEMRRAMAEAEVGDDVYREDPTVRALEEECAGATGKEAALFVPTGSMGNQIALTVWGKPGTEVVLDARGHSLNYELGAMSALAGLLPRAVATPGGWLTEDDLRGCLRPAAAPYYVTPLSLVVLENTHNMSGGTVYPQPELDRVCALAAANGLPVHLDGARIWNASVASGVPVERIARGASSLMFCFSKGLAAPVGSILCGPRAFAEEARRVRKRLGGGMRQAGVIAAAARVAMRTMIERLAEDHANARRLAEGIADLPGLAVRPAEVETNIVVAGCSAAAGSAAELCAALRDRGVLALPAAVDRVRFVTHKDVDRGGIDRAIGAIREVLSAA